SVANRSVFPSPRSTQHARVQRSTPGESGLCAQENLLSSFSVSFSVSSPAPFSVSIFILRGPSGRMSSSIKFRACCSVDFHTIEPLRKISPKGSSARVITGIPSSRKTMRQLMVCLAPFITHSPKIQVLKRKVLHLVQPQHGCYGRGLTLLDGR